MSHKREKRLRRKLEDQIRNALGSYMSWYSHPAEQTTERASKALNELVKTIVRRR